MMNSDERSCLERLVECERRVTAIMDMYAQEDLQAAVAEMRRHFRLKEH